MSDSLLSLFQFDDDEFAGRHVRVTTIDDAKVASVYDVITAALDVQNPRTTWTDLQRRHPEFAGKFSLHQFPGARQQDTPVMRVKHLVEMVLLLPGHRADKFRKGVAKLLVRYLGGDETLVAEVRWFCCSSILCSAILSSAVPLSSLTTTSP